MRLRKVASLQVMFAPEIEIKPQRRENADLAPAERREGIALNVRVGDDVRIGHHFDVTARLSRAANVPEQLRYRRINRRRSAGGPGQIEQVPLLDGGPIVLR